MLPFSITKWLDYIPHLGQESQSNRVLAASWADTDLGSLRWTVTKAPPEAALEEVANRDGKMIKVDEGVI